MRRLSFPRRRQSSNAGGIRPQRAVLPRFNPLRHLRPRLRQMLTPSRRPTRYEIIDDLPAEVFRLARRPNPPAWASFLILDLNDVKPRYSYNAWVGQLDTVGAEPPQCVQFGDLWFYRDGSCIIGNRAYAPNQRVIHSSDGVVAYRPAAPNQLLLASTGDDVFGFLFVPRQGWYRFVPANTPFPPVRALVPGWEAIAIALAVLYLLAILSS